MMLLFPIICLFYIFSSALAASTVLAALVKPGIPLEIVLTKDSRRKETAAIAFKPAKNVQSGSYPEPRFPGDVYPNLKTLLGLPADNTVVKEWSSRHPALQLVTDKTRGTAAFRSGAFVESEEPWTVEEILAMELQSIQKNAEALAGKGSRVRDLVITVPPFYTIEEKRAVQLAAELAGLRVLELVSDGLAVGLNYATSRTFPSISEGAKPEYHMVFDMGAGSTKATVLKFQGRTVKDVGKFNKTIQEVQVLGSGWDRTLGGDALNAIIVDDMIAQFVESPKAQKVSATVEGVQDMRLRQVLSANTNTQASFEGLRADFEKKSETYAARVKVAIQNALDMAELTVKDLDSVILHGGASRTPFVQKALEKIVGKADKIRTNVNSDEAAVFGAAYEAASFAGGIKWANDQGKPQKQQLWKPTSFLGSEKQILFQNRKEFSIEFYQDVPASENVIPGPTEKEVLQITTQNLTDSVAALKEKFSFKIGKLLVDCEVEDIEKPGVVDSMKNMFGFGKKDQAPLEDGESTTETTSTETSSSTATSSSSPQQRAERSLRRPKSQRSQPSTFEVIPIKFKSEIKGRLEVPTKEVLRIKERISAFADSDLDLWEGREATREELKAKLKEMTDIVAPIQNRKEEAAGLPAALEELNKIIGDAKIFIKSITEQIANDTKAHEEFSASKSRAKTETPTATPSPVDESAGLEEDKATETTSAPPEEETLDPPTYKIEDLETTQKLHDEVSAWLADILPKQQALSAASDPILTIKEVQEQGKKLSEAQVELLMKSMKRPFKSSRPTKKVSKPKNAKKTKTDSADKADPTINFGKEGENFIQLGKDGQMPTEEELLAFLEKQSTSENAEEFAKLKEELEAKQAGKDTEPIEGEKPHDEL
ncbi:Hsp70 protein-domain-containing protein [Bisporella sp. PMI_857]|nr:Hsp70 protein-domain-containing protein [Bisporella sp. PMI_857]